MATEDREEWHERLWSKLRPIAARVPFAQDALAAYYCAFDDQTERRVKLTLLAALAYFVLPIDAVPDFIPVLGLGDDAAVLAAAIASVRSAIRDIHRDAAKRALGILVTSG